MLTKYLSKFTIEILPSVFATVVGAYIVNYYIIPKAKEDRAPAAAVATIPDVKAPEAQPKPVDLKSADIKPAETSADIADTLARKAAEKPVEKASDSRRHAPVREKEKSVAKAEPKAEPKVEAKTEPVVATVGSVPADDRRDANDLARAAIERLSKGEPKAQDALRASEASRAPERTASAQTSFVPAPQPIQQAQPMQQLPPPIVVSTPSVEDPSAADVSRGPVPPADVPLPLRADAGSDNRRGSRFNVVDDVLSGAKSMFDKVIPKPFER